MQSFDEMSNGLNAMLSQYDVAEIIGSTVGFVVRLKSAEHVHEVSARFPRYRGMSVRVEVAQVKYTFLGVEATLQDGTYVAKRGVFTALVGRRRRSCPGAPLTGPGCAPPRTRASYGHRSCSWCL